MSRRPRNGRRDVSAVENHLENPQSCRVVFFSRLCAPERGTDPQREMLEGHHCRRSPLEHFQRNRVA